MRIFKIFALWGAIFLLPTVVSAWTGVQVAESDGLVYQHFWVVSSPTPGFCVWEKDENSEPDFHVTNADGFSNMDCENFWMAHCDSDSLAFQGVWPFIDSYFVTSAEFIVELSCTVVISDETRLVAGRLIEAGELDTDEHNLILTYPDNSVVSIFTEESGPEQIQMVLQPGEYGVTLQIHASQSKSYGGVIDPYDGSVWLHWEDSGTVAVNPLNWESIKTYYRP